VLHLQAFKNSLQCSNLSQIARYPWAMKTEATILIPFLKPDNFFCEAISSIGQSCSGNADILLVGPKSLDNEKVSKVHEIVEKTEIEYRVFLASTRNVAQALNVGLSHISTEFVVRFDSDDIMLPERISRQISFLRENPEVGAVGGQISLITSKGFPRIWPRVHYPTDTSVLRKKMLEGCFLAHPSVTMRTEVVKSLGGYREWFDSAEDYDLWLRMLKRSELANLESKVIKYRQHKNQASRKVTEVSKFTAAALQSFLND